MEESEPTASFPRLHQPTGAEDLLSPSVQRGTGDRIPAFELKFVVPEETARRVSAWAASWMLRDAHADPAADGAYQTTTLYLDTSARDVFHRSVGFRRRKFRLRRYGDGESIFLERKSRRQDQVRKRRACVSYGELAALWDAPQLPDDAAWFVAKVNELQLQPTCRVSYGREAFVAAGEAGPLRVTLDRHIRGVPETNWDLTPVAPRAGTAAEILAGDVVCEFKFRDVMPTIFREAIAALELHAGSMSKYRRLMTEITPAAGDGHV
jgi:hypothetical protein